MNTWVKNSGGHVVMPPDRNVVLSLHGIGTNGGTVIFDSSPYAHNPPAVTTNVTTSTTQAKFGATSLSFDGATGSAIQYLPTAEFLFGPKFTLAAWVNPTLVDANRRSLFDFRFDGSGAGTSWAVDFTSSDLRFQVGIGSSLFTATTATTLTANTWQFVSFVRDGDALYASIGGISVASTTGLGSTPSNGASSGSEPFIGDRNDRSQKYGGFMQEVYWRSDCLYPGGLTYTVPAAPFLP